jgi:cytochrome c5
MGTAPFRMLLAGAALAVHGAAIAQGAGPFPEPSDAHLRAGRTVWLGTCRDCHGNSMSDAPYVKNTKDWQPRLARGRAALYASALGGRKGAGGTEMPARGGNANLTDDQVRAAVDYMVWLVEPRKEMR